LKCLVRALAAVLEALQVFSDALPVLWMYPELTQYISSLAHSPALVALTFGRILHELHANVTCHEKGVDLTESAAFLPA
jgi:hypothetical protein